MTSYGVNTLISDSGIIKYRIVTERWDVNTIRKPSRWEFMKGIFFEQFDQQFHTEGYIQADTAWYYDQLKLWKLRGRVRIRNDNGLTMQGSYFRSDEHMSHYIVSNSKGSFTTESMEKDNGSDNSAPKDTTQQQPQAPMRPQAVKHAKTAVP